MNQSTMIAKKTFPSLIIGSIATLLSVGLAACTNPITAKDNTTPSDQTTAQAPMAGAHGGMPMDHGSMNMTLGPKDEAFDLRFINAMIPHHQGAVEMANQVKQNSDRSEVQQLAQNVITSQQQEITEMEQWRQQWYGQ